MKVVCEELIVQAGGAITAPLRAYLTRSQAYLATKGSGGGPTAPVVDLTQQPWALPDQVRKLHDAFVGEQLEKGSQEVLGKMDTWLTDRQALSVLVPPIQVSSPHHHVHSQWQANQNAKGGRDWHRNRRK